MKKLTELEISSCWPKWYTSAPLDGKTIERILWIWYPVHFFSCCLLYSIPFTFMNIGSFRGLNVFSVFSLLLGFGVITIPLTAVLSMTFSILSLLPVQIINWATESEIPPSIAGIISTALFLFPAFLFYGIGYSEYKSRFCLVMIIVANLVQLGSFIAVILRSWWYLRKENSPPIRFTIRTMMIIVVFLALTVCIWGYLIQAAFVSCLAYGLAYVVDLMIAQNRSVLGKPGLKR